MRIGIIGLALAVGIVVGSLVTNRASAQATLQDYTFVVDSTGETWLILRTGPGTMIRVGVPIYPASDAEIAAVPATGQWLIPGDTTRVSLERPTWAVTRPASVAAPAPAAPAPVLAPAVTPPTPVPTVAIVPTAAPTATEIPALLPTATATPQATPASSSPLFPSATFTPLPASHVDLPFTSGAPVMLSALAYESEQGYVYKGRGDRDTAKFSLRGGSYLVRWEASVSSKTPDSCDILARFKNEAAGGTFSTFANKRGITTSREDRVRLEAVPAGQSYFFEIDSNCEWEIEIEPS